LAIVRIALPPLRERREDIAVVADKVVGEWCEAAGAPRLGLSRLALAELTSYAWPGNSRELEQTIEAVLALSRGSEVTAERIRAVLGRRPRRYAAPDVFPLRQLERDYIAGVLSSCNWNQSLAARRLGIGRNTLMRKIKTFGLRSEVVAA
jgi:DNA-binding NtrC family response regulator